MSNPEYVPQIFLCHASDDKARVRRLYHRLREAGLSPWLDDEDILPGQDWDREIRNAIRKSDYFLACLSKNSVDKRGYFQKEIRMALDILDEMPEGQVYLIPARLDDCEVPLRLRERQWIDLFEIGMRGLSRLLMTIASRHPDVAKRLSVVNQTDGLNRHLSTRRALNEDKTTGRHVPLNGLKRYLEKSDWENASRETLIIVRHLAGPHASGRGYIDNPREANQIPAKAIQDIKSMWDSLGREGQHAQYPRVYVPRKSEIEGNYFGESRILNEMLSRFGVEHFIWYLRPDGEIKSGPTDTWFGSAYAELQDTDQTSLKILQFSSVFCSLFPIPIQILTEGLPKCNVEGLDDQPASAEKIRRCLITLEKRHLVYEVSETYFHIHSFASDLVLNETGEEMVVYWVDCAIRAIDFILPESDDSPDWPPNSWITHQASFFAGRGHSSGLIMGAWKKGWATATGCSVLFKLGVYTLRESKHVNWEGDAERYFKDARSFFSGSEISVEKLKCIDAYLEELDGISDSERTFPRNK